MATAAERARIHRLVSSAAGLAISRCEPYLGRGVDAEDLAQAGFLGLLKAAKRFRDDDPSGAKFGTFALPWIDAEVRSELRRSSVIPIGERAARRGDWPSVASLAYPDELVDRASESGVDDRDEEARIAAALRALPPSAQRALTLRFGLDGGRELTLEEVGRRLGTDRKMAAVRITRALQLLRAALESKAGRGPDLRLAFA